MICQYHELSAMIGVGRPGQEITLDDMHKAAWSLYTGTGKMEIPKGVERPFTFKFDALPSRPGMFLMTLRSPFSFTHAKAKAVHLEAGQRLSVEMPLSPFQRKYMEVRPGTWKGRRVAPPEDQWEACANRVLTRSGMAVESLGLHGAQKMRITHSKHKNSSIVMVTATGTVSDPAALADRWVRGATPARAYGLGQITLLPDSDLQAETA